MCIRDSTETMRLFRPQIEELLIARDSSVARWHEQHPDQDVYEDRKLEVTSDYLIDVDMQIAAVNAELEKRAA